MSVVSELDLAAAGGSINTYIVDVGILNQNYINRNINVFASPYLLNKEGEVTKTQTLGTKTDCDLFCEFEKKRAKLGLTKSEAVREALRLFVRDEPPK